MAGVRNLVEAKEFEKELKGTNRPDSFSLGEPYYGHIDPKLDELLNSYPELWGYKFEISHLHRTSYYDWKNAKRAEIEADAMIIEDMAWFSDRPDLKRVLRHLQRAIHQIIWGDAYGGKRQRYLGEQRRRVTFEEMKPEKKKKWGIF